MHRMNIFSFWHWIFSSPYDAVGLRICCISGCMQCFFPFFWKTLATMGLHEQNHMTLWSHVSFMLCRMPFVFKVIAPAFVTLFPVPISEIGTISDPVTSCGCIWMVHWNGNVVTLMNRLALAAVEVILTLSATVENFAKMTTFHFQILQIVEQLVYSKARHTGYDDGCNEIPGNYYLSSTNHFCVTENRDGNYDYTIFVFTGTTSGCHNGKMHCCQHTNWFITMTS